MASKWWIYDWLKNLKTPLWWKVIMGEVQDILIAVILQVGKAYIEALKNKIIEVSLMNITSEQKFKLVFNFALTLGGNVKESILNTLINMLVLQMKDRGYIK